MDRLSRWISRLTANEIGDLVVVLVCLSWAAGVIAGYVLRLAE